MIQQDQKGPMVLNWVVGEQATMAEAAELPRLSVQQVRHFLSMFELEVPRGLIHGN